MDMKMIGTYEYIFVTVSTSLHTLLSTKYYSAQYVEEMKQNLQI